MLNLFRAEWKKTTGNRLLIGCTIWIFPIIGCGLISLLGLIFLAESDSRNAYIAEPFKWTDTALLSWILPNNPLGRLFLMGFAATLFAAEYQYQTWKSVMPGNRRFLVIMAKYLTLSTFIIMVFSATMVVLVIGVGLLNSAFGTGYPPHISQEVLNEFIEDLLLNIFLTFVTTMIFSGIAALASIITRSILYGVMVSVFLSLLEWLGVRIGLAVLTLFLPKRFADIFLITPTYNTGNVISWLNVDEPASPLLQNGNTLSLTTSLIILGIWLVLIVGLSTFAFQRQDIQ